MDRGGRVSVGVTYSATCAGVRIADTGIGIDPEMLPRSFDLFTQAPVAIKQAQGGLSIGLSQVKRLVDLHGGQISVTSEGRSLGSLLTVRIPRG